LDGTANRQPPRGGTDGQRSAARQPDPPAVLP
jgi:hypothetical protein